MSFLNMHDKKRIMVSDFVEQNRARQLLVDEKIEAEKELRQAGLTDELFNKAIASEQDKQKRQFLINKISRLSNQISAINKVIAPLKEKAFLQTRFIEDILMESLPLEIAESLLRERDRRVRGLSPQMVVAEIELSQCSSCDKLRGKNKVLAKGILEYQKILDEGREKIIKWVDQNMPTINKGDYLKSVSIINTCIPTRQELYQINSKYKNLLNVEPNDERSVATGDK